MTHLDLLVTGASVVRPGGQGVERVDVGVKDGLFSMIAPSIEPTDAAQVIDGKGLLAFPGVIDSHCHWGIYNPLAEDAVTESRAAAQGGVTTAITYIRTGRYYLERGGPYADFFPEVLEQTRDRAFVDYAYHLAPMSRRHIEEIPTLIDRFGVSSFKIFMFYGGHGLHGRSDDQAAFLMTPPDERYDLAHFEFVMRGVQEARERRPDIADQISLSLHCETAEIMTAYQRLVEADTFLSGLAAYSASRPPHSEGLAVITAGYLAHVTGLANINLLHLSSARAMEAARTVRTAFPEIDFRREVTIGHLLATTDTATGIYGKVNPPIRGQEDVEALWEALAVGDVSWVVSDHACCREEDKLGDDRDDIWQAKSGFGGTEYLLAGLFSEATRRGVPINRVAELTSLAPARRFGLGSKGDIAVGLDADLVLLDPDRTWTVAASASESSQQYSVFEGFELTGRVEHVWVRGNRVLADGVVVGTPIGKYQARPSGSFTQAGSRAFG